MFSYFSHKKLSSINYNAIADSLLLVWTQPIALGRYFYHYLNRMAYSSIYCSDGFIILPRKMMLPVGLAIPIIRKGLSNVIKSEDLILAERSINCITVTAAASVPLS